MFRNKKKLNIILAMSSDGYFAKSDQDDMKWTGGLDKTIFKVLSFEGNSTILCGPKTFETLPLPLQARRVIVVRSNKRTNLYYESYSAAMAQEISFDSIPGRLKDLNDASIIGGPKLALAALEEGLVKRVYISVIPKKLKKGLGWELSEYLKSKKYSKLNFRNGLELRKYEFWI